MIEERRTLIEKIRDFPAELEALVAGLTAEQLTTPSLAGEWTIAQIVHHLPDSHMNSYIRCKMMATEETPTLKPYDEKLWSQFADASGPDLSLSLDLLKALHARWVIFWQNLPDEAWARQGYHPENDEVVTLDDMLRDYVAHGEAHLDQIRRTLVAQASGTYHPGHDTMQSIGFTKSWHATFPGGHIGLLALGPIDNSQPSVVVLENHKRQLEASLRQKYAGMGRADLLTLTVLAAYKRYYRQFSKTYHVQLQLESVLHKGKSLPVVNLLVDACFAAELETHLLTASHDLDQLAAPLVVAASTGEEQLEQMNGQSRQIKANDMMMCDAQGVICTIIYGQDQRTAVTKATRRVLYVTYAPAGISAEAVAQHHAVLLQNVRLVTADAAVIHQDIITASP